MKKHQLNLIRIKNLALSNNVALTITSQKLRTEDVD